MKTLGTVVSADNEKVKVKSHRKSACDSCEKCQNKGACSIPLVLSESTGEVDFELENTVGAKAGDVVEIEISTRKALMISAFLFFLPSLLTIVFAFVVNSLFTPLKSTLCVIAFFAVSFFAMSKVLNAYSKYRADIKIVKIIEKQDI